MFMLSDYIVVLWLLPVFLCIVAPLVMLVGWETANLLKQIGQLRKRRQSRAQDIAENLGHGVTA